MIAGAAGLWLCQWRISRTPVSGRLAAALVLVATQDMPLAVLAASDPLYGALGYRLTIGQFLALAAAVVVFSGRGSTPAMRTHPLLTGLALGAAVLAVRVTLLLTGHSPLLDAGEPLHVVALVAGCGVVVAACLVVLRSDLPRAVARRVPVVVCLLFSAWLGPTLTGADTPQAGWVVVAAFAAALLGTTSAIQLRSTIIAHADRLAALAERAKRAEAGLVHGREVVHEMRATTAGIVAGADLLASGRVPDGPRRAALEHMVHAEVARMDRLLSERRSDMLSSVSVDRVIATLVLAQGVMGHQVRFRPTGHHVVGRADALAEVLSVLLTNAARHGDGAGTTVTSTAVGSRVEIRVTDNGPGIEHHLRSTLFDWGTRGSRSSGDGIGLQMAHRLALEQGGTLTLDTSDEDRGATFVVCLPLVEERAAGQPEPTRDRELAHAPVRRASGDRSPATHAIPHFS